jgi:hypothetical protein
MSLDDLVRSIVREEISKLGNAAPTGNSALQPLLMTVSDAADATGISKETLRTWIGEGLLPRRTKSALANPKRPTFLVSLDEVRAVAEGRSGRKR